MAIDVYLQLDGIKGESQDDKHKDWIECQSVNWGIQQPRSATSSTAGGHTAERAELREVTFKKIADLASPILIGGIEPSIEPGTILDEHVSLKFSKVKWRYTQQKIGGGTGGSTVGGWDLATNRIAA
jgi:type VI secretion system secreted protein Hcp